MTEGPADDSPGKQALVVDSVPESGESPEAPLKRRYLVWMLLYGLLVGIFALWLPEDDLFGYVIAMPFLFLSFLWCLADARERGLRVGAINRVLLLIFFAVGFPLYLLRSRGWRAPWTFGKVAVFGLMLFILMIVPQYLIYWVAQAVHGK